MPQLPQRASLVSQTAAALRAGIATREWTVHLPGENELCERLQVSRVTLRAALRQLTREGLVRSRQGSRREIIAGLMPRSEQAGNWESERGFTKAGLRLAWPKLHTRVIHHAIVTANPDFFATDEIQIEHR